MKACAACVGLVVLTMAACNDIEAPVVSPLSNVSSTTYEVIDLGTFGGSSAQAFGIDDAGAVYGRYVIADQQRSFRWTKQKGFEDLGGSSATLPFQFLSVNNSGDLAGWTPTAPCCAPAPIRATVWTRRYGFQFIDDEAHSGFAADINSRGEVVGVRRTSTTLNRGFVWNERNGLTEIQPAPFSTTAMTWTANGITDAGEVTGAVSYRRPDNQCCLDLAFVWTRGGGMTLLPSLGGWGVAATDINIKGVVVGAAETRPPLPGETRGPVLTNSPTTDVPIHAWRWSSTNGLEDLGTLGGKHSMAWTVDHAGNAYGWAWDASNNRIAVKWTTEGDIVPLGSLGGTSSNSGKVNSRGVVAGQSATAAGEQHAVVYVPK